MRRVFRAVRIRQRPVRSTTIVRHARAFQTTCSERIAANPSCACDDLPLLGQPRNNGIADGVERYVRAARSYAVRSSAAGGKRAFDAGCGRRHRGFRGGQLSNGGSEQPTGLRICCASAASARDAGGRVPGTHDRYPDGAGRRAEGGGGLCAARSDASGGTSALHHSGRGSLLRHHHQQPSCRSSTASACRRVLLDEEAHALARQPDTSGDAGVQPDDLAYVIYTSGSTGRPKGVEVEHRNVVSLVRPCGRQPGLASTDRLLAVTTLAFDIAGLEIWLPLSVGAHRRHRIAHRRARRRPTGWHCWSSIEITVLQATPASWRLLLAAGWTGKRDLKALCGGEALPRDLAAALARTAAAKLWNMYGPTETTIWSTVGRVTDATETDRHRPPDRQYADIRPGHVGTSSRPPGWRRTLHRRRGRRARISQAARAHGGEVRRRSSLPDGEPSAGLSDRRLARFRGRWRAGAAGPPRSSGQSARVSRRAWGDRGRFWRWLPGVAKACRRGRAGILRRRQRLVGYVTLRGGRAFSNAEMARGAAAAQAARIHGAALVHRACRPCR